MKTHARHTHSRGLFRLVPSLDWLGVAASSLCLVHCLAMPFIVGFLPIIGLQILEGHQAHIGLAYCVLAFALLALVPSYFKHRRNDILAPMFVGLALVLFATYGAQDLLGERWEVPIITCGNLILVVTHLRNRALQCCPAEKAASN